jgi:hypothetical protein
VSKGPIAINDHSGENSRNGAGVEGCSPAIWNLMHPGGDNRPRASPLRKSC